MPAHTAKEVKAFLATQPDEDAVEGLPAYAPELNPEEWCNGAVKRDRLNALPGSVGELHRQVRRSFLRLGRRPALLQSCFDHVGRDVT